MAVRPAPQRPGRALQPEAVPAPRPHLRVVPPDFLTAKARRRRARRLVVLGGVVAAAGLFSVVAFHVILTQGQLDIQQLEARAQAGSVQQQRLRLEAARLESPERVVQDGERLGMVPPATVHYLTPAGDPTATAKPANQVPAPKPVTRATTPQRATAPSTVPAKATAPKPTTPKPATPRPTTAPKTSQPTAATTPARATR